MSSAECALDPRLDPPSLHAALRDLIAAGRVVVDDRAHAVQVYRAAAARDVPVRLPRSAGTHWRVERAR